MSAIGVDRQKLLTHDRLLDVLSYDAISGVFRWKLAMMGRIKAGQVAGTFNGNGHRQIGLDGKIWMAHRLAWFYVHGVWPADEIDHRDLNKDNNAIVNLREATHIENCNNRRASPKTNKSGFKGVSKLRGKWHAQIKHKRRCYHLGYFDDPNEAHAAYVAASKKYHGEFGRLT